MADRTKIEWAEATWSPVVGCSRVSKGCRNCYAIRHAHRMASNPNPLVWLTYTELTVKQDGDLDWTGTVRCLPDRLQEPLHWKKGRIVFVCSMADLFNPKVPNEFIAAAWAAMAACPQHFFIVLTKLPDRMTEWFQWVEKRTEDGKRLFPDDGHDWRLGQFLAVEGRRKGVDGFRKGTRATGWEDFDPRHQPWPLPNVMLCTTIEDKVALPRIDVLRTVPAVARGLSCEPLLEDLGTLDLTGIDWICVGGETGAWKRTAPMNPAWVRSLRDQAKRARAAFFFKRWGNWVPTKYSPKTAPALRAEFGESTVDWHEWDNGEWSVRIPDYQGGRLLDGQEWSETPHAMDGFHEDRYCASR